MYLRNVTMQQRRTSLMFTPMVCKRIFSSTQSMVPASRHHDTITMTQDFDRRPVEATDAATRTTAIFIHHAKQFLELIQLQPD